MAILPSHLQPDGHVATESKGRFNWYVRRAPKGPARLAIKNHFVAMIGEYVGTTLFMIFALGGTNVANIPNTNVTNDTHAGQDGSTASAANTSNLLYIALSFGFSLTVNAWVFFRVSGGLFNPAVSLGMALVGALTPLRAMLLTVSQILGGITGAAILNALLPGTLNVRTTLSVDTSVTRGLFIETFLTAMLMLTILLLAAEKTKATFLAPIGIGLALFIAELLGVYYTGGSLNPARSFGPNVVLRTFASHHWIYWVGPALGAFIAAGFYRLLKFLEYETVLGPEEFNQSTNVPKSPGLAASPALLLDSTTPKVSHPPAKEGTLSASNSDPSTLLPYPKPLFVGTGARTMSGRSTHDRTGQADVGTPQLGTDAGRLTVVGPGLGDLLTEAPPARGIHDLPVLDSRNDERLNRIERLLLELLTREEGAREVTNGASGPKEV